MGFPPQQALEEFQEAVAALAGPVQARAEAEAAPAEEQGFSAPEKRICVGS